jgi:hypothetical protein
VPSAASDPNARLATSRAKRAQLKDAGDQTMKSSKVLAQRKLWEALLRQAEEDQRDAEARMHLAKKMIREIGAMQICVSRNGKPPYLRSPWGTCVDEKSVARNQRRRAVYLPKHSAWRWLIEEGKRAYAARKAKPLE